MLRAIRNLFTKNAPATTLERGWTRIFDYAPGRWQQNSAYDHKSALTYGPVFRCLNLISSDIAKMPILVMEKRSQYWAEVGNTRFGRVLNRPNNIQTRHKFVESWVLSKLQFGNTYVLKQRNTSGTVVALFVIDPARVTPMMTTRGEVFYQIRRDEASGTETDIVVPATEIIHDVHVTFSHPLVGISPIAAAALSAEQGNSIQTSSAKLFANGARPTGILTASGRVDPETADRIVDKWEERFTGDNFGKTALLSDGMVYQTIMSNAVDNQLMEQLQWTGRDVCTAFGVPPYKIGIGEPPAYNNINALDQAYHGQTLQALIENMEQLLQIGLELPDRYRIEIDTRALLRMDSLTQAQVDKELVGAGVMAPNEVRLRRNLPPVEGGESPYLQQQNYSLAALAKRDAKDDPFGKTEAQPPALPAKGDDGNDENTQAAQFLARRFEEQLRA